MGLQAIIFDLDDTLLWDEKSVDTALANTCAYAAEKAGADEAKLQEDVRKIAPELYASYETYRFAKKIGIGVFEAMWANFDDPGEDFAKLRETAMHYRVDVWKKALETQGCEKSGLAEKLSRLFEEERRANPFLFSDTIEVLDALKEQYQLLLLTNGSPDLQRTKLRLSPELSGYFDSIVISGDFGIGKPDPSIFRHALSKLGVAKENAIMVGDNLKTDILGANRIGMRNVRINRRPTDETDIKATYEIAQLSELIPLVKRMSSEVYG